MISCFSGDEIYIGFIGEKENCTLLLAVWMIVVTYNCPSLCLVGKRQHYRQTTASFDLYMRSWPLSSIGTL